MIKFPIQSERQQMLASDLWSYSFAGTNNTFKGGLSQDSQQIIKICSRFNYFLVSLTTYIQLNVGLFLKFSR